MWSFDVFPWGFQHKLFMYMFGVVHSYLAFSLPAAAKGLSSVNPIMGCKGYSQCFCRLWSASHNIVCKYGYFFPSTYLHYTGISYNTVKNKWSSFEKWCGSGAESSANHTPGQTAGQTAVCSPYRRRVCGGDNDFAWLRKTVLFSRTFLKKGQAATYQAF